MLTPIATRPRESLQTTSSIGLVASRYNAEYVEGMVSKAIEELSAIEPQSTTRLVHAPGSFEIPFLARQLIEHDKPDAVICLGVIFEGETGHAGLIAAAVSNTLCMLSVEAGIPVIHAVLYLKNEEQARKRCLEESMNRGTEAARAAIEVLRAARAVTKR